MARLTPEQSGEYRRLLRGITAEAKTLGGRQIGARERLFAALPEGIDPDVALALDGVAQRDQSGPKEGETAPDFELKLLDSDETVRISDFRDRRPVALIFGSYTWPPFRAQLGRIEEIYTRYRDWVEFFIVYVQEAHPTDGWQVDSNLEAGVLYRQPQDYQEREGVAAACTLNLSISLPVLVEEMNNEVDAAYGAAPERLYLLDAQGKVAYHGGSGPHFFNLDEWADALETCVKATV